jgi:hypothetical protein
MKLLRLRPPIRKNIYSMMLWQQAFQRATSHRSMSHPVRERLRLRPRSRPRTGSRIASIGFWDGSADEPATSAWTIGSLAAEKGQSRTRRHLTEGGSIGNFALLQDRERRFASKNATLAAAAVGSGPRQCNLSGRSRSATRRRTAAGALQRSPSSYYSCHNIAMGCQDKAAPGTSAPCPSNVRGGAAVSRLAHVTWPVLGNYSWTAADMTDSYSCRHAGSNSWVHLVQVHRSTAGWCG